MSKEPANNNEHQNKIRYSLKNRSLGPDSFIHKSSGDEWIESSKGQTLHTYKELSQDDKGVVLDCKSQSPHYLYRRLTGVMDEIGNTIENLEVTFFYTLWDIVWSVDGEKHYFYRTGNKKWIERKDDKFINNYEYVKFEKGVLYLFNSEQSKYFKIDDNRLFTGSCLDNINELLFNGKWNNVDQFSPLESFFDTFFMES